MDQMLESLVGQVLAPLGGEVGEDLSQTSSSEHIEIRNQFTEANRDFTRLFEVGREILANQSKDLWAAWALVGGLLWSKKFEPAEAFATSCRVVTGLCERYWPKLYPDSLGLRNTLLTNINKWWNTYIVRGSEGASPAALRMAFEEIRKLDQVLRAAVGGESPQDTIRRFPMLANLNQVSKSLETLLKQSTSGEAKPEPKQESAGAEAQGSSASAAPTSVAAEQGGGSAGTAAPAPLPPSSLDVAFATANKACADGHAADGLRQFQQVLERQGDYASRFRGQVLLGELYLKAKLPTHAKRVLQHAHDQIKEIKLPQWEPKLCTRLWSSLIAAHQQLDKDGEKADNKLLGELFAEICRLDPTTATELSPIREK